MSYLISIPFYLFTIVICALAIYVIIRTTRERDRAVDGLARWRSAWEEHRRWLAKELAQQAKENAALKEKVARLECELFWLKAVPHQPAEAVTLPPSIQQSLDTIDAMRLRRQERLQAEERSRCDDRRGALQECKTEPAGCRG